MKILVCLNYFTPYVSGLTNVARDVAFHLQNKEGVEVSVLAYAHDPNLPLFEEMHGLKIIRVRPWLKIDRGIFSFDYIRKFVSLQKDFDFVHFHAPMLEAGLLSFLTNKEKFITYQCDIAVGNGLKGWFLNSLMDLSSRLAFSRAKHVIVSSLDYASHSRLSTSLLPKAIEIPPSCSLRNSDAAQPKFRCGDGLHIGFLGRIVEEKGIEYLVDGFKSFTDPNARLLIAGDYKRVAGKTKFDQILGKIESDPRIKVLGFIEDLELDDFYASIDLMALTSINSFEAFGITQVEAMMVGIPAISSDLPGVRMPVKNTGMGWVVKRANSQAITDCLSKLDIESINKVAGKELAIKLYEKSNSSEQYFDLFSS